MSSGGERTEKPDVSVVIPAYRAEATIRRAVDSVLAQPGVSVQVLVVIDGRLDRTAEAVADYPADKVMVIEHASNLGAAISRNDGLAAAEADHVMFLDADDFIEGPLLSGLLRSLREKGADVAFGPMQILFEARGLRLPKFVPAFASSEDIFRKWHLEGIYVTPCSVLWRTDFIRGIGGWDPELTRNDDGELVMRAVLKGARLATSAEGCGVYVKHSAETLNNRSDNMDSMLVANEKLLGIESPVISSEVQHQVCAGHYYNIASHAFMAGRDDLGEEALRRSRAMGFSGRGPLRHRMAVRLLGAKRTYKLAGWFKRALAGARAPRRAAG